MPSANLLRIPDLAQEHFEEVCFFWDRLQMALYCPECSWKAYQELEGRFEAHVQCLLAVGDDLILSIKDGLVAEDRAISFAAGYALLRLKSPSAASVTMEAFRQADGEQLEGIRQALCEGPIELVEEQLRKTVATAAAPIAVAAMEALAYHSRLNLEAKRLEQFLSDDNPEVRAAAWRITGQINLARNQKLFETGFADKDLRVRREALWAAAWTQQKWLLAHCRSLCANPAPENWDAFLLLAILGRPEDLQRILALGRSTALGPKRFQIIGAYGHPEGIEDLIRGMESADPRSAVAAGAAFAKITGVDVESDTRVQLLPEDGHEPDDFEKEFLDEPKLPDPQRARAHWQSLREKFAKDTRCCRGLDVSAGAEPDVLDQLDMESRREACLRGKFEGKWAGTPMDLEHFSAF
jgi:uncharacterized protein (TIGR02270 family)